MQNIYTKLPDVWSEGQLFDFSGLDGVTDWFNPTTGVTLGNRAGFQFYSHEKKSLSVAIESEGLLYDEVPRKGRGVVCSDLVDLKIFDNNNATVWVAFIYWKKGSVLGRITIKGKQNAAPHLKVYLVTSSESTGVIEQKGNNIIIRSASEVAILRGNFRHSGSCNSHEEFRRGEISNLPYKGKSELKFAFAELLLGRRDERESEGTFLYNISSQDNIEQLEAFPDFDVQCQKKLNYFQMLPQPKVKDERMLKAFFKACSVLKVNVESPQGEIRFRWTTPDRYPHRNMWLWDSAFQAIGYKHISGRMGEETIQAVLSVQAEDGYIPLCASPQSLECLVDGVRLTQPPTLAWAAWNVYEYTRNKEFLKFCLPKLRRYLKWLIRNRDVNSNGLLEWYVRPNDRICPCGESGMDNSARFVPGETIDSIDLNALVVNEIRHIELICKELSEPEDDELIRKKQELTRLINEKMWDDKDKFYYDLKFNGELLKIKTIASFFPLVARVADEEQAKHLVRHLTDPNEFWAELPVRTLAKNEPSFDRNMWRGPIWINCNYLVICGLKECGYDDIANEISERTIKQISRWYNEEGSIFEFYHDEGKSLLQLPRKNGNAEEVSTVLRDYGWSSALYIELLLNRNSFSLTNGDNGYTVRHSHRASLGLTPENAMGIKESRGDEILSR